jgi:hypothetical protein
METFEIIQELKRLPVEKRLYVIKQTLSALRVEGELNAMSMAAEALQSDYKSDKELTAFKSIDLDDFYGSK